MKLIDFRKIFNTVKNTIATKSIPIAMSFFLFGVLVTYHNCGSGGGEGGSIEAQSSTAGIAFNSPCAPKSYYKGYRQRIECTLDSEVAYVGSQILIEGKECAQPLHEGTKKFSCIVPYLDRDGIYNVSITNPDGTFYTLKNAFGVHGCYREERDFYSVETVWGADYVLPDLCGLPPYHFVLESGDGRVSEYHGVFEAPDFTSETVIKRVDAVGNVDRIVVSTKPHPLEIAYPTGVLYAGEQFRITVKGGQSPFSYIFPDHFTDLGEGFFQISPKAPKGKYQLIVEDSLRKQVVFSITVGRIGITLDRKFITTDNSLGYSVLGGKPPYYISCNPSSCVTSDSKISVKEVGEHKLSVTDSNGSLEEVSFSVLDRLSTLPTGSTKVNSVLKLQFSGGVSPYVFKLVSGVGKVSPEGLFVSSIPGVSTVQISDALGNIVSTAINVESNIHLTYESIMGEDESQTIIPSGGLAPYMFEMVDGTGSLTENGIYTSDSVTTTKIRVTDQLNYMSECEIRKTSLPSMKFPVALPFKHSYSPWQMPITGGKPPYRYYLSREVEPTVVENTCLSISDTGLIVRGNNWRYCQKPIILTVVDQKNDEIKFSISPDLHYTIMVFDYYKE